MKKFDKYWHYHHSVQSPDEDVRFIRKCYRRLKSQEPIFFREDFCSTFAVSIAWVKMGSIYKSLALDMDCKPLNYGKKHYLSDLDLNQRKRIQIIQDNVLNYISKDKVNIVCALNFSYFILKERAELKQYFSNCFYSLYKGGIMIIDCFGGSQCFSANEEKRNYSSFCYYWDQRGFDPITNRAIFDIHYKRKKEKKRKKVFTYNWRLWSIPEIRDVLNEVGFRKTHIYWEGTDEKGFGNGVFSSRKRGEECDSWIAYIISEK